MIADNKILQKVTAFVTRVVGKELELLLFEHPNAGIQIPAGTVEYGEDIEKAVIREVTEETGLKDAEIKHYIGHLDQIAPEETAFVLRKTKVYARPDNSSFDWAEFRRGISVKFHRTEGEFAQVAYEEWDRYPNPQYVTYAIKGWVRTEFLTVASRRYLFHLASAGHEAKKWTQFADNHYFQVFWAPFSALPDIVEPQGYWLEYAQKNLEYNFWR